MVRLAPDPHRTEEGFTLAQSFITTGFGSDFFGGVQVTPIALPVSRLPPSASEPRLTRRERDVLSLPWSKAYAAAAETGMLPPNERGLGGGLQTSRVVVVELSYKSSSSSSSSVE